MICQIMMFFNVKMVKNRELTLLLEFPLKESDLVFFDTLALIFIYK